MKNTKLEKKRQKRIRKEIDKAVQQTDIMSLRSQLNRIAKKLKK